MSSGRRTLRATRSSKKLSSVSESSDEILEKRNSKSDSEPACEDERPDNGGLLDVLAHVATEKLHEEPKSSQSRKSISKITQRSIRSRDVLTLDQISSLTDKALVNLFAEMTANEMKKNYTYTCMLMPDKCCKSFTSFGNESKARIQVKAHLFQHVGQLINDANDPFKTQRVKFTSEPLAARKKRLAAENAMSKKRTRLEDEEPTSPKSTGKNLAKKAGNKSKANENSFGKRSDSGKSVRLATKNQLEKLKQKGSFLRNIRNVKLPHGEGQTVVHTTVHTVRNASWSKFTLEEEETASGTSRKKYKLDEKFGYVDPTPPKKRVVSNDTSDTDSIIRTNEQFIIDLMSRSQPHHDHCYTTIFGKKKGIERLHFDIDSESDSDEEPAAVDVPLRFLTTSQRAILGDTNMTMTRSDKVSMQMKGGLVRTSDNTTLTVLELSKIPHTSDGFPVVSSEEVVGSLEPQIVEVTSNRRYPPMPKDPLARQGKMLVPEEQTSEEEEEVEKKLGKKKKLVEGSSEWERKTALRCIRELKNKDRSDRAVLRCKICQDKTFTASATLMYHYRSHAGAIRLFSIKPFICLVCNTTFTRQHSLNYHMLIHNNMSRFKCHECAREFRHPSHFKEHLRRHTGETPFACTDCPLKFKTRNTYKRHLKTRHGKLLTAQGIYLMPNEEFEKVKTKKYRNRGFTPLDEQEESMVRVDDEEVVVDVESVETKVSRPAQVFVKL